MNKKISIEEIAYNECDSILNESNYIYTTKLWLSFLLKDIKKAMPVVLKIKDFDCNINIYFIGIIFKKGIFNICGSPFEGWSTPYMGFIGLDRIKEDSIKLAIVKKTASYILYKKHCIYFQLCDFNISLDFVNKYRLKHEIHKTYFKDISDDCDTLFKGFKTDVRTNHRRFYDNGLKIVLSKPSKDFALKYYNQLVDVFDKQNLKSYYSLNKIENLMEAFQNNPENILLEDIVYEKENKSIATGIFFGYKKRCYFFGAASYREYQILRPNEEVVWNAIQYWKKLGGL